MLTVHLTSLPSSQSQRATKQQSSPADPIKAPRSTTPSIKPERTESAQPTTVKTTLTHNGKDGSSFPAIQRSTLDVNATPTWINGKSITAVDIDADLAEHSKPWRLPGTDQTDFFNYGFDEYTWAQYCLKQQTMVEGIKEQKAADAQMKAMFGGGNPNGGGQGMPGGMPPMPGMPGMPSPEESKLPISAVGMNTCLDTNLLRSYSDATNDATRPQPLRSQCFYANDDGRRYAGRPRRRRSTTRPIKPAKSTARRLRRWRRIRRLRAEQRISAPSRPARFPTTVRTSCTAEPTRPGRFRWEHGGL